MHEPKIEFVQLDKNEAYSEYANVWLSTLHEYGSIHILDDDAKKVVDFLFEVKAKILRIIYKEESIGYIGFFIRNEYRTKICYLEFIYIAPSFRRKGFAKSAIKYMQEYCKDNNISLIRLWILSINKASIDFFASLGYKPHNIEYGKRIE